MSGAMNARWTYGTLLLYHLHQFSEVLPSYIHHILCPPHVQIILMEDGKSFWGDITMCVFVLISFTQHLPLSAVKESILC